MMKLNTLWGIKMPESNMHQSMQTWLNSDCVEKARDAEFAMIAMSALPSVWDFGDEQAINALQGRVQQSLDEAHLNSEQLTNIKLQIGEAIASSDVIKLSMAQELFLHAMLENFSECQCGVQNKSNLHDISNLAGRLVSMERVVNSGPCHCTAGKELCWKPGFIGTLSAQQRDKYCNDWKPVHESSKLSQNGFDDYGQWILTKIQSVAPKEEFTELQSLNPNMGNLEWHYAYYLHSDTPFSDYMRALEEKK
jgi:hypothetical protein